jgi:hypothetical protein
MYIPNGYPSEIGGFVLRRGVFTLVSIVALASSLIGLAGFGLKACCLIAFVVGFITVALIVGGRKRSYLSVFSSSLAGAITATLMAVVLYVLLRILFVLAVILIALYLIGLLIHLVRRGGLW